MRLVYDTVCLVSHFAGTHSTQEPFGLPRFCARALYVGVTGNSTVLMKVKSEGEQAPPFSSPYININSSLYFIFHNKSVGTLLSPSLFTFLQIGQVSKNLADFVRGARKTHAAVHARPLQRGVGRPAAPVHRR
jgi:hypothetical protein